jgi:Protein of unknown function, DUF255
MPGASVSKRWKWFLCVVVTSLVSSSFLTLRLIADDATGGKSAPAELHGRVVDPAGKPVAGVIVEGRSLRRGDVLIIDAKSDSDGNWKASISDVPLMVGAKSADEKFATIVRLEPGSSTITLRLGPTATAHGKLVDEQGRPATKKQLVYGPTPFITAFGGKVTTDDEGNYTLRGLVPERTYRLSFHWENGDDSFIDDVEPKKPGSLELANLTIPAPLPTLNERAAAYFNRVSDLPERIEPSLKFDTPQSIRLIVAVGDPQSEAARRYMKSIFDFDHTAYEIMPASTENAAAMSFLHTKYGLEIERLKPVTLLILSADNKLLASKNLPWTMSMDEGSLQADLNEFLVAHALPRPNANKLLAAACDRARLEGKCVLLEESGTYCGWCRILSRFFDRHPDIFEASFVLVQIDRDRLPHGYEAMQPYRPSGDGGVPWCVILDADGKKLADWDTPDGNMGFPTLPKEFDHLETILKLAAPKITDRQLAIMRADLEQEAKKYDQH